MCPSSFPVRRSTTISRPVTSCKRTPVTNRLGEEVGMTEEGHTCAPHPSLRNRVLRLIATPMRKASSATTYQPRPRSRRWSQHARPRVLIVSPLHPNVNDKVLFKQLNVGCAPQPCLPREPRLPSTTTHPRAWPACSTSRVPADFPDTVTSSVPSLRRRTWYEVPRGI